MEITITAFSISRLSKYVRKRISKLGWQYSTYNIIYNTYNIISIANVLVNEVKTNSCVFILLFELLYNTVNILSPL